MHFTSPDVLLVEKLSIPPVLLLLYQCISNVLSFAVHALATMLVVNSTTEESPSGPEYER